MKSKLNIVHLFVLYKDMHALILCSQSPRRRDLLLRAGYKFHSESVKVSEIIDENLNLPAAIEKLARLKAQAFVDTHKDLISQPILLLTGDTVVALQGRVYGKPKNEQQAAEYLRLLSGNTHHVISALCLWDLATGKTVTAFDQTEVEFFSLEEEQIADYIGTGEPMDKAGAYGLQGLGRQLVKAIRGSWSNVVGLPMELFEELVAKNGWQLSRQENSNCD